MGGKGKCERMTASPKDRPHPSPERPEPWEVLPYLAKGAPAGVSQVRTSNANSALPRWDQYNQKGPQEGSRRAPVRCDAAWLQ